MEIENSFGPKEFSISILFTKRTKLILGAMGYLAHPALTRESSTSGNYGVLDCIAALKWIKTNIQRFGGSKLTNFIHLPFLGDPDQVTVFGQSAGASMITYLAVLDETKGLFHRAIIQSPVELPLLALEEAEKQGELYASSVGCTQGTDEEVLQCLRDLYMTRAAEGLAQRRK